MTDHRLFDIGTRAIIIIDQMAISTPMIKNFEATRRAIAATMKMR